MYKKILALFILAGALAAPAQAQTITGRFTRIILTGGPCKISTGTRFTPETVW
jgi:hypothetical protein